jgi:predicted flap endonuclease-1-like 5' DNA nuclease
MHAKIRNVGPKSAAWLRQVGVHTRDDLARLGAVETYLKVKRAGFRPSLNLLYALAGAIDDCHWADLSEQRKAELVLAVTTAEAANPIKTRWQKQAERSARREDHSPETGDEPDPAADSDRFDDDRTADAEPDGAE